MKPTPPAVRCKAQDGPAVRPAPAAAAWVEWLPPKPTEGGPGVARLSEAAARWVNDTLKVVTTEKGLRKAEHECLDKLEREGLIQQ